MVRVTRSQGYTLIEVLIALTIFMGLMFMANYSYSLYSQYWHGRLGSFDQTMFYFRGLLQVKESIDSSIPYVVDGAELGKTFYFLGRSDGFTLVSAAPIFAKTVNDAAVVRIFSEKNADDYQLVYEEAPLSQNLLTNLEQQLNFKYRTVLMVTKNKPRFDYFGWRHMEHKKSPTDKADSLPLWQPQYDAAKTQVQPRKIRITLDGLPLEFDLPEGHQSLIDFYLDDLK